MASVSPALRRAGKGVLVIRGGHQGCETLLNEAVRSHCCISGRCPGEARNSGTWARGVRAGQPKGGSGLGQNAMGKIGL